MNLEDLVNGKDLQQDDWSSTAPTFGCNKQLKVIAYAGKTKSGIKSYITKCMTCSRDVELFGEGLFKSAKGALMLGKVPCGCSPKPKWSKEQFTVMCGRAAQHLGLTFVGFVGEWLGKETKCKMHCHDHGEWVSGTITRLVNVGNGCPGCKAEVTRKLKMKPDTIMIASFFASGNFHPDTKFWRSERKNSKGCSAYWCVNCPECGQLGESLTGDLQLGQLPCACSKQRQQEAYINLVVDVDNTVAVKFGIARDSKQRIKSQYRQSTYEVCQHAVYTFPSVAACKAAERECKKELDCGVILKRDMPDGYTETTHVYNLDKIIQIYKNHGGVKL